jgi:hypothetical protein
MPLSTTITEGQTGRLADLAALKDDYDQRHPTDPLPAWSAPYSPILYMEIRRLLAVDYNTVTGGSLPTNKPFTGQLAHTAALHARFNLIHGPGVVNLTPALSVLSTRAVFAAPGQVAVSLTPKTITTTPVAVSPTVAATFVDYVTQPIFRGTGNVANNVGCLVGVGRTTVSSVTQSNGALHQNLTITGKITITTTNQTFRNCRFTYSYAGDGGGGMVDTQSGTLNGDNAAMNGGGTRFEFCEFEPTTPGDRFNGVYGHDFTMYRCAVTRCVDGTGGYNPNGPDLNVQLLCSWFGPMAWFEDDREPLGGHSDGTHNDISMQHGSGWHLEIRGCFLQCAKYNVLNPGNVVLSSDWKTYTLSNGNGVTPLTETAANHMRPQAGQGYLGQHSAYYVIDDLTLSDNWIWNFDCGIKFMCNRTASTKAHDGSTPSGTRYTIPNIDVTDNVFGGRPRSWGTTTPYMPMRFDTNCLVNGRDFRGPTSGQQQQYDLHNNRWDANVVLAGAQTFVDDGKNIKANLIRYLIDNVPLP